MGVPAAAIWPWAVVVAKDEVDLLCVSEVKPMRLTRISCRAGWEVLVFSEPRTLEATGSWGRRSQHMWEPQIGYSPAIGPWVNHVASHAPLFSSLINRGQQLHCPSFKKSNKVWYLTQCPVYKKLINDSSYNHPEYFSQRKPSSPH